MCFKVNSKMPGGINLGWNALVIINSHSDFTCEKRYLMLTLESTGIKFKKKVKKGKVLKWLDLATVFWMFSNVKWLDKLLYSLSEDELK